MPRSSSPSQCPSLFMMACAVRSPADWIGSGDRIRAVSAEGWGWLVAIARAHGFAGLLARNLGWAGQALSIPIPAVAELAALRRLQLPRLLVLQAAAREAGEALATREVPFVLFKGAALAEEIYGDLSLRAFGDMDILVPAAHLPAASDTLLRLGYAIELGDIAAYRRRGAHAADFRRPNSAVDLHWELSGSEFRPENQEPIWANTRKGPPDGLPGLRFNAAMNFVYLATHFYWHGFRTFKPMLDAYMAARMAPEEGPAVVALARALDRFEIVQFTAILCEKHFPSTPLLAGLASMPATLRTRVAARLLGVGHFLAPDGGRADPDHRISRLMIAGNRRTITEAVRQVAWPRPSELAERFGRPYRPALYSAYFARQARRLVSRSGKAFDEFD